MSRGEPSIYRYERSLRRNGFSLVAGTDEAGRGACAGPLVAAAVILRPTVKIEGLGDSKALTPRQRDLVYDRILAHALAWSVVSIPPGECDTLGMHVANLAALRRAVMRLDVAPDFVISDGFAVDGLAAPSLAMWKGDQVAACVAAASVVAKVTRDRVMTQLHETYPEYSFDIHKGYCTALHQERLDRFGPSAIHRFIFENVRRAAVVQGVTAQPVLEVEGGASSGEPVLEVEGRSSSAKPALGPGRRLGPGESVLQDPRSARPQPPPGGARVPVPAWPRVGQS